MKSGVAAASESRIAPSPIGRMEAALTQRRHALNWHHANIYPVNEMQSWGGIFASPG